MGAKGAAETMFKKEIQKAEKPEEELARRENEYRTHFAHPYVAAARGYVDEVIMPEETREKLLSAYGMLEHKVDKLPRKKHGNIPL